MDYKPIERIPWDQYFMIIAKTIALRSSCNSRPGGAIIIKDNRILATGYVGSVKGTKQCSDEGPLFCYRRDLKVPDYDKYNWCRSIHAEANALNFASKFGISVDSGSIYCTLQPCILCLKAIAASGIKEIYFEHWYDSKNIKRDQLWKEKLKEYGIKHKQILVKDLWKSTATEFITSITSERKLKATS